MARKTRKIVRILALCLAMLFLTACANGTSGGGGSGGNPTEVIIGAIYPLTGTMATTGLEIRNGIELAVDVINNNWPDLNLPLASGEGIPSLGGAKIAIHWGDSQANPELGMAVAEQILNQENAVAIMGTFNSAVTATVAQVTERHQMVFLNPDSTNPGLTRNGWEWFFRITPDDYTFAFNLVEFMKDLNTYKGADIRTVSVVYDNTLTGQDVGELFNRLATDAGFEVILDLMYAPASPELNSEVLRIQQADADAILCFASISEALLFMKTYEEVGYFPKIFIANGAGFTDSAFMQNLGPASNYIFNRSAFSLDIGARKPIVNQLNEIFNERYGINMNEFSARGFMGVITLADAINRAGSTDSEAIRQALLETDIPGDQIPLSWGGIRFDPATGQNILDTSMVGQKIDGTFPTVWPFDLAVTEPIFPAPGWHER